MKKIVLGSVVIGAVAIAAMLSRITAKQPENDSPRSEVTRAVRRDLASVVKATGVIKPMVGAEVRVGSSVSGVVAHLFVRIGDRVQRGQLLAELDSRELVARRDSAQAALQLSQANLSYALADLRRKRDLSTAQIIAPSELDLAEQAHSVAEQQCNQAQANLADANTQLGFARIVAPISGIVESVSTQEGETVAANFAAPTFVTLVDLSRLEVWAYVDETDIGRIRTGQKARFTVDTYGDYEFEGRVVAVHPQAEIRDNVVDYVTVVRFKQPRERVLRPEMTTTAKIALEQHSNVLALPFRAVRRDGGRQFVVTRNGNTTERRAVVTGMRDESYWEILDGLHEGEEVLVGETKKE